MTPTKDTKAKDRPRLAFLPVAGELLRVLRVVETNDTLHGPRVFVEVQTEEDGVRINFELIPT